MQCEVRDAADHWLVVLSGEVDLSTSPEARKAILDCLAARRPVLVDLSGVTYIDSSGIASLVEGYQNARSAGLKFCLVDVSEAAQSVLELARLNKVFPIFANAAECLGRVD
jgi:anti-sigma B factor antagonist